MTKTAIADFCGIQEIMLAVLGQSKKNTTQHNTKLTLGGKVSSFTSVTLGNINTPVNILKEFLATFNRRQKCKAAILSWLDGKHYYGQEWVRITFENLADILGYCRETISKHIKELVKDCLIEEQSSHKFPKDTACEYRLNLERLIQILGLGESINVRASSQCEKFNADMSNISDRYANNPSTYETNLNFLENNNTAVDEEKEVDLENREALRNSNQVDRTNIQQDIRDNDELFLEETYLTGEIESDEDKFPQEQVEVITTSHKPTKLEIKEICTELKRLRINPEPCLGAVKAYWQNVDGAISRVKEALKEGWCKNPTGLFINSCKSGVEARVVVSSEVSDWFEWARKQRIVIAMSEGMVYTANGEGVKIEEMMQRYPLKT